MLNSQSPVPLYHQLAEILQDRIRSGTYGPGEMIPSEIGLAKQYGIGRPTVRQAMNLLVQKGLIQRKRGAGTFVKKPSPRIDLFSLAGTSQAFSTRGIPIKTKIITPIHQETIKTDVNNPFHGSPAFCLSRLTLAQDCPVLLEEIFMDTELFAGIEKMDLTNQSLAQIVSEQYYLNPRDGSQQFTVENPGVHRAQLLGLSPQEPILVVRREINFPKASRAIFSLLFCRTDQFAFSQTIRGES
ncbi:MAG: GntR family transcriptional regulator [Desulfobacter sp.]|nr:GntR family transcriptional regulator [Desulfobacter sp.]WDP84681.1 MAG: GntR family transcriptional regulator [Desulfobacter sp.]